MTPARSYPTKPTSMQALLQGLEIALEALRRGGRVPIQDLADHFSESPATIRKRLRPWFMQDVLSTGPLLNIDANESFVESVPVGLFTQGSLLLRTAEAEALRIGLGHLADLDGWTHRDLIPGLLRKLELTDPARPRGPGMRHPRVAASPPPDSQLPQGVSDYIGQRWVRLTVHGWAQPEPVAPLALARASGRTLLCVLRDDVDAQWVSTDRIIACTPTDRLVTPAERDHVRRTSTSDWGDGVPVVLHLDPDAAWAVEAYGLTPRDDGLFAKDLESVEAAVRMVLRLAGAATVMEPAEVRAAVAVRASALAERLQT